MGMDVFGKSGNYFRASIWSWHPLAHYCQTIGHFLSEECKYWHSNDGDGLGAEEAELLGKVLLREIEQGNAQKAVDAYIEQQSKLVCEFCKGERQIGANQCGFCEGTGTRENYNRLSVERIKEFADFLIASKGFYIC